MANSILTPGKQALIDEHNAQPLIHHAPDGFSDQFALGFTKLLRLTADTFFAKRYGHRAIVREGASTLEDTDKVRELLHDSFRPKSCR